MKNQQKYKKKQYTMPFIDQYVSERNEDVLKNGYYKKLQN